MRATLAILLLAHSSALLLAPLRCVSPPTSHAPRMAIPDEVAEVAPLRCVSPPTRAALRMAIPDEVAEAMADAEEAAAARAAAAPRKAAAAAATRQRVPASARATPGGAPSSRSLAVEMGAVDLDLCLSMSSVDAAQVAAEADEVFDAIDANSDGAISLEELRSHIAGSGYSPAAVQAMFDGLDTNGDRSVSRDELRAGFQRSSSATLRLALGLPSKVAPSGGAVDDARGDLADELFDTIDSNGDGEIVSRATAHHPPPCEAASECMLYRRGAVVPRAWRPPEEARVLAAHRRRDLCGARHQL